VNFNSAASTFDLKVLVPQKKAVGLWLMMSGYRLRYLGATLSLGGSALAKTSTYLLLRYFVDNYFGQGSPTIGLPIIALGFILLALVEGGLSFTSGRLAAQTAEGITRRLRNYLFDHIQYLPFTYHDHTQTGELIQRCSSDVDALRRFYADQAIGIGRITLLFIINFIAIIQINLELALLSVIIVPILVITSLFFFKKVSIAYEKNQEQEAVLSTTLQENLTGVRVVKAFARQNYEIDKFDRENREKYRRGRRLLMMHSLFWPITDTLCGFQMLGGFLLGAMMAINGTITIGSYLAYAGLIVWIIFPMRNLGRLIVQTSTGMVSYGRVIDIIRQNRENLDEGDYLPEGNLKGLVEFKDVCFEYQSGISAIEHITFTAYPGDVVALLGSTGSGKTTLVNLLPRFYEYTDGSIHLDGVELNRYPRRYLRKQIGIVEQEPFLFSRSIKENIIYGVERDISQEQIETAARAAAIHDVIMSFPNGYHTLVGEKGVTLSGGQKQRVAIARTLLKNPRILIFDDSTSSVDMETEAEIRQALENLMQNRTTFIIAHRIQSIMEANLILVLDKGKIVQRGTHEQLLNEDGIYRQIYEIQTRIEDELEKELTGAC